MGKADIIAAYDGFYTGLDAEWRLLSAKYKARNILKVCKGKTFNRVLEVGAGDGSILFYLERWNFASELHALEISQSGVDHINARGLDKLKSVQIFDGYHIPFENDSFDLVILSHVLEHVEFERQLLREIRRVAAFVLIEVPRDYRYGVDKKMRHFLDYGHINIYTPTMLRFLVNSEGFEVISDNISLIQPEVSRYNAFVNLKKKKSWLRSLKIDIEFLVKNLLIRIGGRRAHERFANAYTVLLKRTRDAAILG